MSEIFARRRSFHNPPTHPGKYGGGWKRWQQWASSKAEVQEIPANPWYVAIFFNHLLHANGTPGALHRAAYGIRWAHHAAGYPSPLEDPFVALVLQGCGRLCARPVKKKDPLTASLVKGLIDHYSPLSQLSDLHILRFLVIVVVGFAGFFRIDEMVSIKLRSVQIHDGHMQIALAHCKNDQMRKGNEILVARTNSAYCPVGLTELFWQKAQMDGTNSDTFFIPRLLATKSGHAAHKSAGISYTTAYEQFKAFIQPATTEGTRFPPPPPPPPPHSLRSGGASQAAASGVAEWLISKHGRWRSERARNAYLEDTFENRLTVSRSLGL